MKSLTHNYKIYTIKGLYRILSRLDSHDPEFNRIKKELKARGFNDEMYNVLKALPEKKHEYGYD